MKTRIVSAVIFLVIFCVLYHYFEVKALLGLSALLLLGGTDEYFSLIKERVQINLKFKILFLVNAVGLFISIFDSQQLFICWFILSWIAFASYFVFQTTEKNLDETFFAQSFICLAFVYCVLIPSLMGKLIMGPYGKELFFMTLILVFSGDTAAYFFGKFFGKSKLHPSISPNKTKVGSLFGLIFSGIAAGVCSLLLFNGSYFWYFIGIGFLGGALGQAGDLFESHLKRFSGKKDSGIIMPGHGGFLDRFDGVYFVIPLMFSLQTYFLTELVF